MNPPPGELQKLMQHIDQLIEQAADETSRAELERLKARLNTPEMLDMARELAGSPRARPEELVLEFHDPLLPPVLTAAGCVIATAVCLFAVVDGFKTNTAFVAGTSVNLWLVAALAGALSVMFSARILVGGLRDQLVDMLQQLLQFSGRWVHRAQYRGRLTA